MRFLKRGPEPEPLADEWEVSEGSYDGRRLITCFNTAARKLAGSSRYGIRIGIAVPFRQPDAEGMPSPKELTQLVAFEDALGHQAAGKAVLVGVITTGGMREFVLYTGSGDWIAAFHESLRAAMPSHDVQVVAKTDPDWSVYRQFVKV